MMIFFVVRQPSVGLSLGSQTQTAGVDVMSEKLLKKTIPEAKWKLIKELPTLI